MSGHDGPHHEDPEADHGRVGESKDFESPPDRGDGGTPDLSEFEPPTSDAFAAEAAESPTAADAEYLRRFPTALLRARDDVEGALLDRFRSFGMRAMTDQDAVGEGNLRGVGIGLGAPGQGVPGTPSLTLFVAERTALNDAKALVVDGFGARSASDVPVSVVVSGFFDIQPHRFRLRAAPGGISVGHPDVTAGTFGCLARGKRAPRTNRLLLLSNNHVLAATNAGELGDCIMQPGRLDGGVCPADEIAQLERFVRINAGGMNRVDCATAWCFPERVRPELIEIVDGQRTFFRISSQVLPARLGMTVGKSGRTTQVTQGIITAINTAATVSYGIGQAFFTGQIAVQSTTAGQSFSQGGDSGSVVWTWDETRNPVGLLYAGSSNTTLCNPMTEVLAALDINLFT
jgi:hypothetical protein